MKASGIKHHAFPVLLLCSIALGGILGFALKGDALILKPLGDVFLNLLFTVVVPLVFFSISSAVAGVAGGKRLGKILLWMLLIFIVTGLIASALMVLAVKIFPPVVQLDLSQMPEMAPAGTNLSAQIVGAFTVSDFSDLLSRKNMLPLILFSILFGLAVSASGEKGRAAGNFLAAGHRVMMKIISYIMLYAPIGLFAYFAYLTGNFGTGLFQSYVRVVAIYYPVAFGYFFVAFSIYAFLAGGISGLKKFWPNIIAPAATALGTGSSIATIPANLEAADRIGTPKEVSEIVIPVGATIHMDGSCLAAILKIALLFSVFQIPFAGFGTIASAIGISLLCGVVMSGIPGGGFLGEMLIISLYGFPIEALPIISAVGILVDPPATMVNAVGDNVAGMLVARIIHPVRGRKISQMDSFLI